ncbi:hypothetical protein, partial [Streptomyces sp. NPDC058086]|uniref:hypothetical protein n=1 Tax=Streptomyces sp. NPDC058086 TaxID=3346334 RepID=UPI0036E5538B
MAKFNHVFDFVCQSDSAPVTVSGRARGFLLLLTFSDWLRGIGGEGQSGFGEAAVDELGVTLDVGKPSAEGAGE